MTMNHCFARFLQLLTASILAVALAPASRADDAQNAWTGTQAALRLELQDQSESRTAQLRKIAGEEHAPPLTRWSLGEIQSPQGWIAYRDALAASERSPALEKYLRARDQYPSDSVDHLALANLCRSLGLWDEEHAHLLQAVAADWRNRELHFRLGHVNIGGFWFSPADLQRSAVQQQRQAMLREQWLPAASRIVAAIRSAKSATRLQEALASLREVKTPDAIPAVEQVLAGEGPQGVMLFIDWLAGIDSYEASEALAKVAIMADTPEVRVAAQGKLKDRRWEEFVPWLLAGLETVQVSTTDVQIDPGLVTRLRVVQQVVVNGQEVDLRVTNTRTFDTTALGSGVQISPQLGRVDVRVYLVGGSAVNYSNEIGDLLAALSREQIAEDWREFSQQLRTDRIARTLAAATGQSNFESAEDWWSWWRSHYDIERTVKASYEDGYESEYFTYQGTVTPIQQLTFSVINNSSCFAADTLVETERGPRRIDSIRVGDRVLTQDVLTGELGFRAVQQTTVRPGAQVLRIRSGGETIVCSIGHPLWVSGLGWRMARELTPGMLLHTISGGMRIESIEPAGTASVHNLVVPDAHTYFAGEQRLLTHDVTPRRPSDLVLPGVRKEF